MNVYAVAKSSDGIEWVEVGNVDARSRGEAIAKALRRDKHGHERFWRTTLFACMSGRELGKIKIVEFASAPGLSRVKLDKAGMAVCNTLPT